MKNLILIFMLASVMACGGNKEEATDASTDAGVGVVINEDSVSDSGTDIDSGTDSSVSSDEPVADAGMDSGTSK